MRTMQSFFFSAVVALVFSPLHAQGCPIPKIQSISVSNQITLGAWADLEVICLNDGPSPSPDGGISASFPSFTAPTDAALVVDNGSSSGTARLTLYPNSSTIHNNQCKTMTASYLLAELADSSWSINKTNVLRLRVQPKAAGEFSIYVRSAMACDISSCIYFPDPQGSLSYDQQGWMVYKRIINVCQPQTFYFDGDNDNYGNPQMSVTSCSQPPNYVVNNLDCDDGNPTIHPGATEPSCGGPDLNCDRIAPPRCVMNDCNHNGIEDADDIAKGQARDCNTNSIPDECDISNATSRDCNTNGVPDECETSSDEGRLWYFDSTTEKWACSGSFKDDQPTIVLVHGWNPELQTIDINDTWTIKMATAIHRRTDVSINLLAWDWLKTAGPGIDDAINAITDQAIKLSKRLQEVLPTTYNKPVQLMGHSFGAFLVGFSAEDLSMAGHPPSQVTLFDPADFGLVDPADFGLVKHFTKIGALTQSVRNLRRAGCYVDVYSGLVTAISHSANIYVDIPLLVHSVYNWYLDTVPLGTDPALYSNAPCAEIDRLSGTLGFGTSTVLGITADRPTSACQEAYTLYFGHSFPCGAKQFLRTADQCFSLEAIPTPIGIVGFTNSSCMGVCTESDKGDEVTLQTSNEGGGSIGRGGSTFIAVFEIRDYFLDQAADYLSFEYNFVDAFPATVLDVTIQQTDTTLFSITSDAVIKDRYRTSNLQDIGSFRGTSVTIRFEVQSAMPGVHVKIRNPQLWQGPSHGNSAPIANAGPDQSVCSPLGTSTIGLDASGTTDANNDIVSYTWIDSNGDIIAQGIKSSLELTTGIQAITLIVRDAADNVSTDTLTVTVSEETASCKRNLPGDCTGDNALDISDALCLLGFLFLGNPNKIPCQASEKFSQLLDWDGNNSTDITDAVNLLNWLFLGGKPHILGSTCSNVSGCTEDKCQ